MERNNQAVQIDSHRLPTPEEAVQALKAHGRHLTLFSPFGRDPLAGHPQLIAEREDKFREQYPDFGPFFS